MFKNLSIFIKLAIEAGIILLFLVITGVIGFVGISVISSKLDTIHQTTFQSEAAKAMGNAVFRDVISATVIQHADSEKKLNGAWNNHLEYVKNFDNGVDKLLDLLKSAKGELDDASIQQMQALVKQADEYHNQKLQPWFQQTYDITSSEIALHQQAHSTMKQLDVVYDKLIQQVESLESGLKDQISIRIRKGASAASIRNRENNWAHMAMMMKTSLTNSRFAVEEFGQKLEKQDALEIEKEYSASKKEFNSWIRSLLDGSDAARGKFADGIRKNVLEIQSLYQKVYMVQADKFIQIQKQLAETGLQKQKTVEAAKKTADQMNKLLLKVEHLADQNMKQADNEANSAAVKADILMIAAVILSIIISIFFIMLISRGITRPLKKAVDFADTMSKGDFTSLLDIKQQDEVGILAESLNRMVASLSRMIRRTHDGISTLSATSSELSSLSEVMATGAENTAEKSNTVASASEEMNSNVESVAAAMEEATLSVNNISAAVEEMNANFGEVTERIRQTSKNTQQAASVSEDSSRVVAELGKAASEIETIAETINSIADKTSLLALNATIEAARAGEAGKGFAVVAGEIKSLAQQVSNSTSDIGKKLKAIQDSSQSTISGISEISEVIALVNESMESISVSMEQQSHATKEISENISQTSDGLREVNENISQTSQAVAQVTQEIGDVNKSAHEISTSSNEVQQNADTLMDLSRQLSEQIAEFKTEDTGFSAGPAKLAHSAWKRKLADLLAGKKDLQVSEITSHKECEFGQWYFSKGSAEYSKNPTFQAIDGKHQKVHDMAKEITGLYHKGEVDQAMTKFQEFTKVTSDLFRLFDQLEDEA